MPQQEDASAAAAIETTVVPVVQPLRHQRQDRHRPPPGSGERIPVVPPLDPYFFRRAPDPHVCHPDYPSASQPWAQDQVLHVAAFYFNPAGWHARRKLFNEFRRHVESSPNVRLYVGEVALGDRPFEVTDPACPTDFRFRTDHWLWHKERVLNIVIGRFQPGWTYGAYADGDFHFSRYDWGLATIETLQTYHWAQMFHAYADLGPDGRPLSVKPGFAYALAHGLDVNGLLARRYSWVGAPGGAWAFRRHSYEACGGLLDTCILGAGDHHMAIGLAGLGVEFARGHPDLRGSGYKKLISGDVPGNDNYRRSILNWQARATRAVNGNVGYVPIFALHGFHGDKSKRGYGTRWKLLPGYSFDPHRDIYPDSQGLWQLTDDKPRLREAIRRYFTSRVEDDLRHPAPLVRGCHDETMRP